MGVASHPHFVQNGWLKPLFFLFFFFKVFINFNFFFKFLIMYMDLYHVFRGTNVNFHQILDES
jgi:hypothetical protein